MAGGGGIPQGIDVNQPFGASTMGSSGKWNTGNVSAVMGSDDKLKAFDPNTMFSTYTPGGPEVQGPKGVAAGMSSSGLPSYMTNWLASGAQGPAPTSSSGNGFGGTEMSTPGAVTTAQPGMLDHSMDDAWKSYITERQRVDPSLRYIPPGSGSSGAGQTPAAPGMGQSGSGVPGNAPPGVGQPGQPFTMQQLQQLINEPWFKQRQWEQYGSPNANIGMNMAGTNPVGYGAETWFTPGRPPPGWGYGA